MSHGSHTSNGSLSEISVRAAPASLAFLIWSLSALAFGYAFFQRVAPSVMVPDLMAEFAVSGAVLGQLSALYFYPYALLQPPLGAILDRFGARLTLTVAVGLAAAGTLLFASAATLWLAYLGRFLIGAGVASGWLGTLAVIVQNFPARRFALLAGGTQAFGMAGATMGQVPLSLVVEAQGWRAAMGSLALFGVLMADEVPGRRPRYEALDPHRLPSAADRRRLFWDTPCRVFGFPSTT